ncbi:MAG TPA: hypothetical protein VGY56_17445 [Verrucomicrobiae bacterium]|nr:hypothetical protein [Verrucomicrobiae bacterium]
MALFEITKRSFVPFNSLTTPQPDASLATGTVVNPRGVAFQFDSTDGQAVMADGTKAFAGFITRYTKVDGPTLEDVVYPGRTELPFVAGGPASFEYAEEVEVEGPPGVNSTYVIGTGASAISAATAAETKLSFSGGAFCVAQTGQDAEFILVAQMTPEVTGNIRFRARKITGQQQ